MAAEAERKDTPTRIDVAGRRAARLAAVQAIYQMAATGAPAERVLAEFLRHRLPSPEARAAYEGADRTFFAEIVRGVATDRPHLDEVIGAVLAQDWTLDRLDRVLHAILRAGAYEISQRADIPARAVISEYVDVARSFFEGKEPGFVNGVLDRLARAVRPDEMGQRSGEPSTDPG
jgi:N utilization substance protein B